MQKNYKAEEILPFSEKRTTKGEQVEEMFDEIAPRYDFLNHALSFSFDKGWRKKGIQAIQPLNPKKILDVATGTGDLAIQACKTLAPDFVLGIDISEEMMRIGEEKVAKLGWEKLIRFQKDDSLHLSLESDSFDAVIVAFGVRNFENLDQGLREILRVLRPGGRLMILELTTPEYFPMKQLYKLYSKVVIPTIGRFISLSKNAYSYLPESIAAFPQGEEMTGILSKNGYVDACYKRLTMGICTMYVADKAD